MKCTAIHEIDRRNVVAIVGPAMMKVAAEECDGVLLHGFCTRKYLEDVVVPRLETGLGHSGRSRDQFEISGGGFVATGADGFECG